MKIFAAVLAAFATAAMSDTASAQMTADDLKWVNQCISDNKGEKVGPRPSSAPIAFA